MKRAREERRLVPRYRLRIPLEIICFREGERTCFETKSLSISARGMSFAVPLQLEIGEILQITLRMPKEVVPRSAGDWRCRCRVVHAEASSRWRKLTRAGVEIQYYEILKFQPAACETISGLRSREARVNAGA